MTDRTSRLALAAAEALHALAEALTDWAEDGLPESAPEPDGPQDAAPAPDPLDENDHRDRVTADRLRIVRHGRGHWHWHLPAIYGKRCDVDCTEVSLRDWAHHHGPLTFDHDAAPDAPRADLTASEGEDDAVEGGGPAGLSEVLLCRECGHAIDEHRGLGCTWCICHLAPSDIARHMIAQATS